jgi:tetratricopeptide (TPR) repeat protein
LSEKIRKEDGRRAIGFYNKGCIYLREGKFGEGVKLLKKALKLDPTLGLAHIALGEAYYKRGMYEEAIPEYTKTLYAPYSWTALRKIFRKLVRNAKKNGDYLEALRNFDCLISLSHVHQKCFGGKHVDEKGFAGGHVDKAKIVLEEIFAKNSLFDFTMKNSGFVEVDTLLSANDYKILGKIFPKLGRPKDAIVAQKRADKLKSTAPPVKNKAKKPYESEEAQSAFAEYKRLRKLGRTEEAEEMYFRYVDLTPVDVSEFYTEYVIQIDSSGAHTNHKITKSPEFIKNANRGVSLYRKARVISSTHKAVQYLKEALKLNPYYDSYPPFWSLLGDVLQKLGEHEEAMECFDRRIEIEEKKNPPPSSLLFSKAVSLMELHRLREAKEILKQLVEKIPSSKRYRKKLKECNDLLSKGNVSFIQNKKIVCANH